MNDTFEMVVMFALCSIALFFLVSVVFEDIGDNIAEAIIGVFESIATAMGDLFDLSFDSLSYGRRRQMRRSRELFLLKLKYIEERKLCERADEQHWWVENGALIGDVECMEVGIFGDFPPHEMFATRGEVSVERFMAIAHMSANERGALPAIQ